MKDERPNRIAIASDHAGFFGKEEIKQTLKTRKIEIVDCGPDSDDPVDYPDYAQKVACLVSREEVSAGILVCGTGIGMSMAANKVPGIRAALATTPEMAKLSRAHNDANILCLGGRTIQPKTRAAIVEAWLDHPFEGGRHERRVKKISEIEKRSSSNGGTDKC